MKGRELAAILLTDPEALVVVAGYEGQLDEAKVVIKTTVIEDGNGEYYGTLNVSDKENATRCFYVFNKRHDDDYFTIAKSKAERTILLDEQEDYSGC
jgi:hypothetical protein